MAGVTESTDKRIRTINNYPLAFTVFFVTALLTTFINQLFNSTDKQIEYYQNRIIKLENQVDKYTNTVMFKEATEKELKEKIFNQQKELDSLKGGYPK